MAGTAGAAGIIWALLVFANYLATHGLTAEFAVPSVYLRQWYAAWPGWTVGAVTGARHAWEIAAAGAILIAGAGGGGALAGWVSGGGRGALLDRLALGAGVLALAVFGLGLAGLAAVPVFWVMVAGGLAWSLPPFARLAREAAARCPRSPWAAALAGIVACLLVLDLLAALTPEWSYDSLLYHLAVPARILLDHRFTLLEGHMQFSFPLNPEMLYTAAMALGGEAAAKALNVGIWILAVGAVARLVRILTPAPLAALLAVALFYSQPVLGVEAEAAFAESGWTLWIAMAAVHAASDRPRIGLVGAYAGLAAGAKYLAVLQALPLALILLPALRRRGAFLAGGLFAVVALPWYVKNWLFQLDPFFPALAPYGMAFGFTEDKLALKELEVADYGLPVVTRPWLFLILPWDYVQHDLGGRYWQETSGPLLLALAPLGLFALLARPHSPARRVSFLGTVWALIWAGSNQWDRLLVPALAPAAALVAWAAGEIGPSRIRRILVAVTVGWAGWSGLLRMDRRLALDRYYQLNEATSGKLSRSEWAARHLPMGPLLPALRERLPANAKVLVVHEQLGYGLPVRYVWESVQSQALLARLASESRSIPDLRRRLRQNGITHLIISRAGRAKAAAWGQYGGLSMRAEGLLETFIDLLPPPNLSAGPLALYALPPAGR